MAHQTRAHASSSDLRTLLPRRLGHANLFVSNLAASCDFYRKVCGFQEVFEEPAINAAFLSNGNTHHDLGLIETSSKDRIGADGKIQIKASERGSFASLNHFGFEMGTEKDLVEGYERLLKRGVKVSRTVDHGLAHSVYLQDPDGNMLEFYADVLDDWRSFWKDSVGKLVTVPWDPHAKSPDELPHFPEDFVPQREPDSIVPSIRITGGALTTRALSDMIDFYVNIIGMTVADRSRSDGRVILRGTVKQDDLMLIEVAPDENAGLHSMYFEVATQRELDIARNDLEAHGIEVVENTPSRFSIRDPDGFIIEFLAHK